MRVRVATLNTWALPQPFGTDTRTRLRHIGAQLADLDADVIAFQEVWSRNAKRALVRAGREAGLEHVHNRSQVGESGLLTLSRFPIESERFEAFHVRGDVRDLDNGEFLSGKGLAWVRILTPHGPLAILNTHLHARYTRSTAHEYQAHRIAQIVQLASSARDVREPLVALGDFNFTEHHPEYGILRGLARFRDSAADLDRRAPTVYAANPYRRGRDNPDKRIDYAFYRGGDARSLHAIRVDRVFDEFFDLDDHTASFSNHAGVLAEFELAGAPDAAAASPHLDGDALALASKFISQGRAAALERRTGERTLAGAGLGLAALAAATGRNEKVSRRAFLRRSVRGATAAAIVASGTYSLLAEVVVPEEIEVFDTAAADLEGLARTRARDGLQIS